MNNDSGVTILESSHCYLRAFVLKEYLLRLRKLVDSNEVSKEALATKKLVRISDSFLLGNSSERISGT